MKGIHIIATGRALPAKIMDNDEMSTFVETSDEWIQTRTGIKQRHVCKQESCASLAIEAAKKAIFKAIDTASINTKDIGVIVVATTTPDYAFPSTACLVQKALELPEEVMSFDISAACSGFLYGLDICRGLLMSSSKKYALLIGSEQLSRILNYEDRTSCILFGDGAGAAILELDDSLYYQRSWSDGDDECLTCKGSGFDNAHLQMQGNKVFKFAVKVIPESIEQILEDSNLKMNDIDYFICHQANIRIIDHVRKKYPEYSDRFYINIDRYGNTSAASIPIVMDEMKEKGLLKTGMKVICVGFGAGFTWSCVLLTI